MKGKRHLKKVYRNKNDRQNKKRKSTGACADASASAQQATRSRKRRKSESVKRIKSTRTYSARPKHRAAGDADGGATSGTASGAAGGAAHTAPPAGTTSSAHEPVAPPRAEPTDELTTPEEYIRTDLRKLLSVIKIDLRKPVWTVHDKYIIVTEQNLPCKHPGYWTAGRDPPGPCQFLVFPKTSRTERENAVNESSQNPVDSNSNGLSINEDNPNSDSNLNNVEICCESNIFNRTSEEFDECLKNEISNVSDIKNKGKSNNETDELNTNNHEPFSKKPDLTSNLFNDQIDNHLKKDKLKNENKTIHEKHKSNSKFHDEPLGSKINSPNKKNTDEFDNCSNESKKIDENQENVDNINDSNTNIDNHESNCLKENQNVVETDKGGNVDERRTNGDFHDPLMKEHNSAQVNHSGLGDANKFIKNHNNMFIDDDNSDSDYESNKLQIVEDENFGDCTDVNHIGTIDHQNDKPDDVNTNVNVNLQGVDNTNDTIVDRKDLTDHTYSKPKGPESSRNAGHTRSIIKVKSFANVGRMEPKPVTLDADGNPDIIKKNNKFYKKLLDVPDDSGSTTCIPMYALMLSAVTSVEQCDQLLHRRVPLQVLERHRGLLHPLRASDREPTRVHYHDPAFLTDLGEQFQTFLASNPSHHNQTYEFETLSEHRDDIGSAADCSGQY